ncbi:MAG: DUF4013 domain-containing protein [Chloroflexales bacterium]|nr:DUF4013 domain-containing protein [Chloroflexales bacterium]
MLRTALATLHRDRNWWWKIPLGGMFALTIVGYPLAVGLVIESMDNTRRGYPTPLPPWRDWSTRYILGLFASLIDFVFFGFPLIIAGMLTFCVSLGSIVSSPEFNQALPLIIMGIGVLTGLFWLTLFFSSVAPVARLMYVNEGRIEDALGSAPLRRALDPRYRSDYFQARLLSLVAYIPAALLGLILVVLLQQSFAGDTLVMSLLAWLILSAILYAHLVAVQLYVAADRGIAQVHTG